MIEEKNNDNPNEKKGLSDEIIAEHYRIYVSSKGVDFNSIFELAQKLSCKESDIYEYFSSLKQIREYISKSVINSTLIRMGSDVDKSFREKFLTFQFIWIEELTEIRSYIKIVENKYPGEFFSAIRETIEELTTSHLKAASDSQEIPERFVFSKYYPSTFVNHIRGVMYFWLKDDSHQFQDTDAAIEKGTNFWCDLVSNGLFDSGIDFAKFIYSTSDKFLSLENIGCFSSSVLKKTECMNDNLTKLKSDLCNKTSKYKIKDFYLFRFLEKCKNTVL